jgi:hypothetical protein
MRRSPWLRCQTTHSKSRKTTREKKTSFRRLLEHGGVWQSEYLQEGMKLTARQISTSRHSYHNLILSRQT